MTTRFFSHAEFPFLCLLISGGHSLILLARGIGDYVQLGTTLDDSVGEAIDKAARILGYDYNIKTGPAAMIVNAAKNAPTFPKFKLPVPMSPIITRSMDMSFSGLKTALITGLGESLHDGAPLTESAQSCWSKAFLDACAEHLIDRCDRAIEFVLKNVPTCRHFVISGGVARNDLIIGPYESCNFN